MNHKFRPIAIIGYAGRFPGASNMKELLNLLMEGRDEIGPISEKRLRETALPIGKEYNVGGFLSDIDKFDYKFFNYAPIEAMSMDPHVRLAIENTYHCLEDSGYGLSFFKGTNTMVIAAASTLNYYEHADEFDPTLVTGNDLPFLSATISRKFGLRGLSAVTHSSCSSSLSAIQMACDALSLGRSEHALVVSSNIMLFPEKMGFGLGLDSKEGKSKSFSSEADGMSNGEASVSILLKPLDEAIKDNDNIHAVIRAIGSNNDADLSASITSPDYISQSNLLKEVWEMANIDPRKIEYIEAHGSGTELGDSMEVLALDTGFRNYTKDNHFCSLSTIKTNIGHSKSASGIAGLAKAVLSVEKGKLFPHLHFKKPSSLIDFDNSAMKIQKELENWDTDKGDKRLAGLTSMGLSGTNFHAIIEQAPDRIEKEKIWQKLFLVAISAPSPEGLVNKLEQMEEIINEDFKIEDIASTLLSGREHFGFRKVGLLQNKEDFKNFIKSGTKNIVKKVQGTKKLKLLFLAVQTNLNDKKRISHFKSFYPDYRENFDYCISIATEKDNPLVIELAAQYSFFKLLEKTGITTDFIIAIGTGEWLLKAINKTITLKEALDQAAKEDPLVIKEIELRTQAMLSREKEKGFPVFIDLGVTSPISKQLYNLNKNDRSFLLANHSDDKDPFLALLEKWYGLGENFNWQFVSHLFKGKKISLPLYPFEKTRCWIRELPKEQDTIGVPDAEENDDFLRNASELELSVIKLWGDTLRVRIQSYDDNFFELGGNSLQASKVIIHLNQLYDANLSFEDIFEFQTISQLVDYIKEQVGIVYRLKMIWRKVLKLDKVNEQDHFFDLGGHSLLANNLINGIEKELKIRLNFEDVFKHPTFRELTEYIEQTILGKKNKIFAQIEKTEKQENYPLSTYQEKLWSKSLLDKNTLISYNEQMTFWFHGSLNHNALEKSFESLSIRHEILRTVFKETKEGIVRQYIKTPEECNFKIDNEDISIISENKDEAFIQNIVLKLASAPFDLSEGPLLKGTLVKVTGKKYLFSLVMHRTITDGWSKGIMMKELLFLYSLYNSGKVNPLIPLRIQYKDYVIWQQEQLEKGVLKKHKEYWLKQFEGELPVVTFPTEKILPATKTYLGNSIVTEIDATLTKGLREITQEEGTTMFMNLVAVVNTMLYKYTDQKDIIIGSPISNRHHSDLEDQLGAYANTLALRTKFKKDVSYRKLLNQIKNITLEAYNHQEYPFSELEKELSFLNKTDHDSIFNVMVILHNTEAYNKNDLQKIGDLSIEGYENNKNVNTKHHLIFDFFEMEEKMMMHITYNASMYDQYAINNLISYLEVLLYDIIEKPNQSILLLPIPNLAFDKA